MQSVSQWTIRVKATDLKGNGMKIYIEKERCMQDAENGCLILPEEECKECEFRYTCRFMSQAMDEVVNGD